jgi:hypothetical protein
MSNANRVYYTALRNAVKVVKQSYKAKKAPSHDPPHAPRQSAKSCLSKLWVDGTDENWYSAVRFSDKSVHWVKYTPILALAVKQPAVVKADKALKEAIRQLAAKKPVARPVTAARKVSATRPVAAAAARKVPAGRKSPPEHASEFKNKTRRGIDGNMWTSLPNVNGVFRWTKTK